MRVDLKRAEEILNAAPWPMPVRWTVEELEWLAGVELAARFDDAKGCPCGWGRRFSPFDLGGYSTGGLLFEVSRDFGQHLLDRAYAFIGSESATPGES